MAGRGGVERECRRLNRARQVLMRNAYSCSEFWRRTRGSFLIAGGTGEERAAALAEYLTQTLAFGGDPVVVLNGSEDLEARMEEVGHQLAGTLEKSGRFLRISSPRFPDYAFFRGWTRQETVFMLQQTADRAGYPTEDLTGYANALLDILNANGRYELDLESIFALSGHSDEEIREIGRRSGASPISLDSIFTLSTGRENYRRALEHFWQGVEALSSRDGPDNWQPNLSGEALGPGCVHMIRMASRFPDVLELYFAEELRRLTTRDQRVHIICCDIPLEAEEELDRFLRRGQASGSTISAASPRPDLSGEEFMKGFQNYMILPWSSRVRGQEVRYPAAVLEAFFQPLGDYPHYEPMLSKGGPMTLLPFSLRSDSHWSPGSEQRLRVRASDTEGIDAVLYGCSGGEILLVRNMTGLTGEASTAALVP